MYVDSCGHHSESALLNLQAILPVVFGVAHRLCSWVGLFNAIPVLAACVVFSATVEPRVQGKKLLGQMQLKLGVICPKCVLSSAVGAHP